MNKPANDDSISRVFPKKTSLCFLEALGSLMFLLGRGCQRLGQPIDNYFFKVFTKRLRLISQ
jgi:hypothetical protein